MNDYILNAYTAVVTALLAVVAFLVRKILTNDSEIKILQKEIATRNEYQKQKDEEFQNSLIVIQSDIKLLIGKMTRDIRDGV